MRLFVPLLNNGNGDIKANFMVCWAEAFSGKDVFICSISDSHAGRAMNKTACSFLDSGCDIWVNIDADILFTKKDIDHLLEGNLPLVYGVYPKKNDACEPCLGTFDVRPEPDETGRAVVRRAGRGFMAVRRELLERMKEENGGPALAYHNHGKTEWEFFPSGVVTGEMSAMPEGQREFLSEDWAFCERARALGVPTILDTRIVLGHEGSKVYRFKETDLCRTDANISSWRDIHGWFDYESFYRDLAGKLPDGSTFVEVGCWLGRSVAAFANFAQEAGKTFDLHAVDTFDGAPASGEQAAILAAHGGDISGAFKRNMERLGVSLTLHHGDSSAAAAGFENETVGAAFIDASHAEADVLRDILAWWPKIKPGGILAGHDYDMIDVRQAVEKSGLTVRQIGRCWEATK